MKNKIAINLLLITLVTCLTLYITIINAQDKFDNDKFDNIEESYFNKWNGKSWLTLGDSITKASGYQDMVGYKLGFSKIDNKGLNGQTMAYQKTEKSTYYIGREIDYNEYDLVTIFIGTNDFRYNKKVGKIETTHNEPYDEQTFLGSYQLLIEKILSSNSSADIVLITPLQRTRDGYDINFTNEVGHKLINYVNGIKELGEIYSIPILDLYSTSGFTEKTMEIYTRDGLHPNEEGYNRISEKLYRFLLNI